MGKVARKLKKIKKKKNIKIKSTLNFILNRNKNALILVVRNCLDEVVRNTTLPYTDILSDDSDSMTLTLYWYEYCIIRGINIKNKQIK